MKTKKGERKNSRTLRSIAVAAAALAIVGMIVAAPLYAGAGNGRYGGGPRVRCDGDGPHGYGRGEGMHGGRYRCDAGPGMRHHGTWGAGDIDFLAVALDLSETQVKEIEPVLAEQREKMLQLREELGMGRGWGPDRGRNGMRMNRMHRCGDYGNVDRTELRARMRREQREFEKNHEKFLERIERARNECDEKLAKILDQGQMEKWRKFRALRDWLRCPKRQRVDIGACPASVPYLSKTASDTPSTGVQFGAWRSGSPATRP